MDISDYNNETIDELQKLDLPAGIDVEIQAFGAGGE
jgi:small subunit ribosomal protein S10